MTSLDSEGSRASDRCGAPGTVAFSPDRHGLSGAPDALPASAAAALAGRFRALSDPNRVRILSIVGANPEPETCVCDISEPLGLSQPTVSHHLRVLVEAGLLTRAKRGVWAYYSSVPGALEELTAPLRIAR